MPVGMAAGVVRRRGKARGPVPAIGVPAFRTVQTLYVLMTHPVLRIAPITSLTWGGAATARQMTSESSLPLVRTTPLPSRMAGLARIVTAASITAPWC